MADATEIVQTCEGCQFYTRQTHLMAQALQTIPITWPFTVGPLQKAPKDFTHLLVAIGKFSKWIEVYPINKIKSKQAMLFITDIIHQFGMHYASSQTMTHNSPGGNSWTSATYTTYMWTG